MSRDDPTPELTRLQNASDRIAANLLELEIDSSRQLLEVSVLSGRSADSWATASATLTELWRWQGLLKQLLERAEKLRSPWRAGELRALLDGKSIELSRAEVPLAERDLLGGPEVTVRCTADELLARMSRAFDEVKIVVARFGEAWGALTPRVTAAQTALDDAQKLAVGLGEQHRRDLDEAARALARLATSASADPLSTGPDELDRLLESLHEIRRDLDATAALRREFDARLADARARLASLVRTVGDALAAHEEALVKIAVPTAPEPPPPPGDLGGELDQIAAHAGSGDWREARRRLDAWTDRTNALLDEAESALRANRAPIDARNQLRALLEAYQVKASRLGAIEDPELQAVFAQAHEALFTAPTDLSVAAQLVRRYQEILNAPRPAPEAIR